MKWEDTVMNTDEIHDDVIDEVGYSEGSLIEPRIAETQAEISFKAGYEQALKDNGLIN